jgi:hypothetical protein
MAKRKTSPRGVVKNIRDNKTKEPSKKEKKQDAIWDLYLASSSEKEATSRPWQDFWKSFKHEQWPDSTPSWKSKPVDNITRTMVESTAALVTDHRVEPLLKPRYPEAAPLADTLQSIFDFILENNWIEGKSQDLARGAGILGTWWISAKWNPDLAGERGDIEIEVHSSQNIFPAPGYEEEEDCPYFLVVRTVDEYELREKFGSKFDPEDIPEGVMAPEVDNDLGATIVPHGASPRSLVVHDPDGDITKVDLSGDGEDGAVRVSARKYTHIEAYIMDDVVDSEGNKVFPEGRMIDWVNGKILRDQPNPFGFMPYTRYVCYKIPGKIWGEGLVEMLQGIQKSTNKVLGQIIDNLRLVGNPVIMKTAGSIAESLEGKLFTYPGAVWTVRRDINSVRFMDVPPLNPQFFQLYGTLRNAADDLSGISEVARGGRPKNVESAQGIALVQESAQLRIRQMQRNLDETFHKLYIKVLKLIKRFYTDERMIAFTDGEGRPHFSQINGIVAVSDEFDTRIPDQVARIAEPIEDNLSVEAEFFPGQNFETDNGDIIQPLREGGLIVWRLNPIDQADFSVHVVPGSSLPVEQRIRGAEAMQLAQLGILDPESLLEALDWPNRDKIIRRIKEQEAAALEAQAAQQLQQGGGQPPQAGGLSTFDPNIQLPA